MAIKKVVIVGAGPAGLTAAYELLKRGGDRFDVTIIEETQNVGGIARNESLNSNILDIGGHNYHTENELVKEWWNKFLPITGKPAYDYRIIKKDMPVAFSGPDPDSCSDVMILRKKNYSVYRHGKFYNYPFSLNSKTNKNLGFAKSFKANASKLYSQIFSTHEQYLEDCLVNRYGKDIYTRFIEHYTEKVLGKHPAEIYNISDNNNFDGLFLEKEIKKDSESSYYYYPKYGAGQLWQKVALEIKKMGGKFLFNCRVVEIAHNASMVTSVRFNYNGQENDLPADMLFSTMPLRDLMGAFTPQPPDDILDISQNLIYRDLQTVGVLVSELKIKCPFSLSLGELVPENCIYVNDSSVKLSKIHVYNNRSPYMIKNVFGTVLLGLEYYCREGDMYWTMSDKDLYDLVISELVKIGLIEAPKVIELCRFKTKKALPIFHGEYANINRIQSYLNGFYNLYCIGRNGQHRCYNIDQAMLTAFEAVDNIILNKTSKANIWTINVH